MADAAAVDLSSDDDVELDVESSDDVPLVKKQQKSVRCNIQVLQ